MSCARKTRFRTMKRAWKASNWHDGTACLKCADGLVLRPYRCAVPGHGCHLGHTSRARLSA